MKQDAFYQKLVGKMSEVSSLPPQEMGILTTSYKRIVPFLKVSPWRILLIISLMVAFIFRIALGPSITHLVSILQTGF